MPAEPPRRAHSLEEFRALQGRMILADEVPASIASYRPRPTDIVIAPAGKCGTTWLQQTFHTLRTGGDMDFDDISRVVPWIETARTLGIDLDAPQRAEPRGFKSHLPFDRLPTGAKYVVSFRDPKDALVSMYRFMEGWFIEPGTISIEDFAQGWFAIRPDGPSYWGHLLSWWGERDNPAVLLLSYEDMSRSPQRMIRRLADFCGIPLGDELLALTLERSSLAYMLAHKDRFDDAMMRATSEARCNLPRGGDSAKVRAGAVGGHRRELPPAIAAALDETWTRLAAPKLGFATYAEFEKAVSRR